MHSDHIKSYKQHKLDPDETFDAIIIGSGMSGLTCAAILAKEGKRALVLEKHYTAGGYTHVFKRSGYEWDVGIHYIGAVNKPGTLLWRLFHYLSDGELQWEDMGTVYDKAIFGDETFEFHKGKENFKRQMFSYFPDTVDQRAIEQYLELIKKANKASQNYFAEKALPPLVAKVVGGRMRKEFLQYARQTTRETLEELTSNEKLIAVLTTQFGDYGMSPGESSFGIHALVVNHYLYGAAFPIGGSSRIAETIADVIGKAGGLVLTNAGVDQIALEGKKAVGVKLEDGTVLKAPLIISSAGIFNTYKRMLPEEMSARFKLNKQLDKVKPSVAHLGLYIGFKESVEALGLQKANYWIYPEDGYNHDQNIARYLDDPEAPFPVVYVSFPSSKDPDWENRYPGKSTVDIITLAPYEWFEKWAETKWKRRGDEYDALKERFAERLLDVLYRYEPQLRGKVDHYELSTPLSTRDFVSYQSGEIYGIDHDPERFEQTFLRPHTPIKNLYLTGQDIVTAGVGGALMSGALTMSAIDGTNYISKIAKAVPKPE